jgi:anti-sigma B factor antagonist
VTDLHPIDQATAELTLSVDTIPNGFAIRLKGELDLSSAELLDREVTTLQSDGAKAVVIDLAGLEFIDSTGIGLLVKHTVRARRDGGAKVLLAAPRGQVADMFRLAGLDRILPFTD